MHKSFIVLALIFCSTLSLEADYKCFAPPNTWGPPCYASSNLAGTAGTYVNYHIIIKNPSTTIYCEGVGMSQYDVKNCGWGWKALGAIGSRYISLIWDNKNAFPGIRCYGTPYSSDLTWTFSSGVSDKSCIKADSFLNRIQAERGFSPLNEDSTSA